MYSFSRRGIPRLRSVDRSIPAGSPDEDTLDSGDDDQRNRGTLRLVSPYFISDMRSKLTIQSPYSPNLAPNPRPKLMGKPTI
jgi:hypothetical protein